MTCRWRKPGFRSDMHDVLQHETHDARAAAAVALFCYQVKKWIGAFAATLGGLNTLVFAGGIGEDAPSVRARICDGLGFLGIGLEEKRSAAPSTRHILRLPSFLARGPPGESASAAEWECWLQRVSRQSQSRRHAVNRAPTNTDGIRNVKGIPRC